jgi:RNA polymerase sigma factor (sigma-70 family)
MAYAEEDEARFAEIVRDYGASLRRVARSYAAATSEVDDLTQEIALAVWRALPSFRGDASLRTFVFRVAHNRGLSHVGSSKTRERNTPLVDPPPHVAEQRPPPDVALDDARRRERLFEAIRKLPIGSRSVLLLALEGMNHTEIAEVLGSTANSVGVRIHRARQELRAQLGEDQ